MNADGTERSATTWLKSYLESLPDVGYPFMNKGGTNAINDFVNNQFVSVFPNPASDILQLSLVENVTSYQAFDLLGQPLITHSNPQSSAIDISRLNSGIYLIKIRQKEEAKTIRFVKK